jgi:hypothetical protein
MIDTRKRDERVITPRLRVSDSKKKANDFEHTKAVMDNYIGSGMFNNELAGPSSSTDKRDLRVLYQAYNNTLPAEYFTYVVNPLNSSNPDYTNWPARLRPFSIIRPNIDLIEGEYEKRPLLWTVKVHNADAANQMLDQQYQEILSSLQQQFINALNQRGVPTDMENQQVELPSVIKAKFSSNYKDERAIMGEAALNIIIDDAHLIEKWKRMFHDWTTAGEVYSYKGIYGQKVCYDRVSPLDVDYDKSPDAEYCEDGQWFVRKMWMTPSEIQDKFYKELSEKEIDIIEDGNGYLTTKVSEFATDFDGREDEDLKRSKVPVYHVTWKYLVKLGIVSYLNQFGEIEEVEVPENYKASDGETIEWYWVNEVWEGYRISADIYLGIGPIPGQRNTVNNLSECKLPYNGKRFSDTHTQNTSLVEMGLPYETLHRILHYNLEKTIAKSKGKIALIDQMAIPKQNGWDEEKFFYWADATGWGLLNRNQPGADKTFNQYTVLDLGLYQHIGSLIDLMAFVKLEWDELLGISPQRKGEVKASDSVRGTQAAISQSAVISEKVFSRFEEFVECELRGLLDISKLAWQDGFTALYQGDDMRNVILSVDPAKYTETDYGVYISRSARDIENLEMVRQQVQAFAQNGVPPSTIIDVVQAQSLSKLRSILRQAEAESMQAQQGAMQSEAEAAERLEMIKQSFMELQAYLDRSNMDAEYDRKEEIEHIKGAYQTYKNVEGTGDNNANGIPDALEVRKQFADESNNAQKLTLEQYKAQRQDAQKTRELDIKEKELKVRKDIADKQAKVALKNKVAGEGKSKK